MNFGQITNPHKKYSHNCDYIQFDICGLNKTEAVEKFKNIYNTNPHISQIILHSDWSKKGCSENNLPNRINDYIDIYTELSKYTKVIALTLHPMFKTKSSLENFLLLVNKLEQYMPVYIENRSNSKILISTPKEIIELSNIKFMTIDIPQLFISCNYDYTLFTETLLNINWSNVKEIHLANIKRDNNRTYVGRSLDDGLLKIQDFISFLDNKYITLEILGGVNIFDENVKKLKNL